MPKRRAKRAVKKPVSPTPSTNVDDAEHTDQQDPPIESKEDSARQQECRRPVLPLGFIGEDATGALHGFEYKYHHHIFTGPDYPVERQTAAIRAMRDMDIDRLLTGLRLFRSYLKPEQLKTPFLQFVKENLPNLSVSGEHGHYDVKWKDEDGNLYLNQDGERNTQASLLHQMFKTYSDCSAPPASLGRFEFSSKAGKARILGADNLQIKDFVCSVSSYTGSQMLFALFLSVDNFRVLEEPSESAMLGLQEAFQTPGVNSQRLSVGMTPKTLRLPKYGEMLLSVHGSPLGVYKDDNMEAIRETEETS